MVHSKSHLNKERERERGARRGDHYPTHRLDFGDAALGSVEHIKSTVSRTIVERPLESVLIAAGLGILCGRFRSSAMAGLCFSAGAGLAAGFLLAKKTKSSRR